MLAYSSADPSKLDGLRNPVKAGNVVSSSRLLREMLRRRERGEKNRPRQALSLSFFCPLSNNNTAVEKTEREKEN